LYYLLGHRARRAEYDVSVTVPYLFSRTRPAGKADGDAQGHHFCQRAVFIRRFQRFFTNGISSLNSDCRRYQGLGTGESDYGVFLGLHQRIEDFKLSLMGT
jgi:hypothetical protein